MGFVIIAVFVLWSWGIYLLLTEYVIYPSRRTERLYQGGQRKKEGSWVERVGAPLARWLEPKLSMNPYKEERLTHTLRTIGEPHNAIQYMASAMAQSVIVMLIGVPGMVLTPLFPLVTIVCGVVAYLHTMGEPEKRLAEKRERIERELPRFASTISNSLSVSRDIVKLMENYRRVCGPELADELDVTLADLKTGNAQTALKGLENRIGSTKLSELVRGLLSVLRGEDQTLYFYTKNVEFRKEYMEVSKQEIQKRPSKLTPYIVAIVICYLVMLLYILGYQVMRGGNAIF